MPWGAGEKVPRWDKKDLKAQGMTKRRHKQSVASLKDMERVNAALAARDRAERIQAVKDKHDFRIQMLLAQEASLWAMARAARQNAAKLTAAGKKPRRAVELVQHALRVENDARRMTRRIADARRTREREVRKAQSQK